MAVDSSCRLLIVPLFRGSSRFESLILSHHSGFSVACKCHEEEINNNDDVWQDVRIAAGAAARVGVVLNPKP